jgi:hypothetical protein
MPFRLKDRIRSSRQIDSDMRQRFVHRSKTITHADDPFAIAKRLVEGLSQRQSHILHRVMVIDMKVTRCLHGQIKQSVYREVGQHMVKKSDAGGNHVLAPAIEIQLDLYLCLVGMSQ